MEADLRPLNLGLSSAWREASGRADWRRIVDKATLWKSTPSEEEDRDGQAEFAVSLYEPLCDRLRTALSVGLLLDLFTLMARLS